MLPYLLIDAIKQEIREIADLVRQLRAAKRSS